MTQDHPADISREDWLRVELDAVAREIEQCKNSKSWQALAALRRLALQYRNELDDLLREKPQEFEPTTIEDVIGQVLQLPDEVFRHEDIRARVAACVSL